MNDDPAEAGPGESQVTEETKFVFRLFVTGVTPQSTRAIVNTRKLCEEHLKGRYELEVIDICLAPKFAELEQIVAAPTLLKKHPLPVRRFIGDMSQTSRILQGLRLSEGSNGD